MLDTGCLRASRVKMTVSVLCAGLGLGASSTGRRDSFDRNTSAFSPSLEYSRAKWPQSYGALGKNSFVVCEMYSDTRGVGRLEKHVRMFPLCRKRTGKCK